MKINYHNIWQWIAMGLNDLDWLLQVLSVKVVDFGSCSVIKRVVPPVVLW